MPALPSSTGEARAAKVYALAAGELNHPDRWLFEDGDEDIVKAKHPYPDFCFLIQHHTGKNVLFDLGLTKVSTA